LCQKDVTHRHSALWHEAQCAPLAAQLLDIHL
jgi:hypothetical protein